MTDAEVLMEFIEAVQSTSGLQLQHLVKDWHSKYPKVISKFLRYTYDKLAYTYGVKPTDIYVSTINLSIDLDYLYGQLDRLAARRLTGNAAKDLVASLLLEYGIIAYSILNRKIPNAVLGPAVINKAVPNLIQEFKVAKAKDLEYSKLPDQFYMERKYDGNNLYIIGNRIFTRNGEEVFLPELQKDLKSINFQDVLVCEAYVKCGKLGDRKIVQGLLTKGRKQTITSAEEARIKYAVFDYIVLDEWVSKKCYTTYEARIEDITKFLFIMNKASDATMHQPERKYGTTEADVQEFLTKELSAGFEGIVVKPRQHYFEFKRSWNWMRYKEAHTLDCKVVGVQEGSGKFTGMLGAAICHAKYRDKFLEINVGQGFTEQQRKDFWPTDLIGKVIEITYNEITDKTVTIPIFKAVREDKEDYDNG
jgi:DNA ligase-1